jgi:threonine/homoserine/homoserine lactone efflux protein
MALPFCLAVPVGWTLLMVASGLGLGALITGLPALRGGVKLVGIAYMVWLALKLARAGTLAVADVRRLGVGFFQGVVLQFVNIKAWLLALTLAAGWVATGGNVTERLGIVCLTMMVFAFASNFSYALVGALLRQWLAQGVRLLWFNRAMACVLLATALWMLSL